MKNYETTLKKWFGFDKFRDKQLDIIKATLEDKKDVCTVMFTGAGKSLCYQFPPVHTNKTCLVISPLISLMNDQRLKMDEQGIPVCCLNSTVGNKNTLKEEILQNKYRLVYTTPEYLITQEQFIRQLCQTSVLCLVAIDEAHVVSTWAQDFREAYKKLSCVREWVPNIPIIALTATATKKVQADILSVLKLKNPLVIKTTFDRPNLIIRLIPKGSTPMHDLLNVMEADEPTIVYCQTRNMTDEISEALTKNKIASESYHAGMGASERSKVHEDFSAGKTNCVVATIAFGMGIDITIRKVIHYGMPKDMESYYQEIGRAGRDGLKSDCYLFYALSDMNNTNYFLNQIKNIQYRNHMLQLSLIMKNYIFSSECRRKYILEYFGEEYTKDNCAACDNCLSGKKVVTFDFAKDAKLLFETLNLTGNVYGGGMIINVLRGSGSKKIPNKFKKSELYGGGTHHTEKWWKILLTIIINNQYVKEKPISGGHGFTLCNTPKSSEWLKLYKAKPDTKLILQVPDDMQKLLPTISKPKISVSTLNLNIDSDDDIAIGNEIDDMIEAVYSKKSKNNTSNMINKLENTYDLFHNKNKTIKEIATELDLNATTIEGYLVKLYEKGYKLDMDKLKFNDDVYNTISKKIKELNHPKELSTIKNSLPHGMSYLHIKLTQAKMDKSKLQVVTDVEVKKEEEEEEEYVIAKGKKKVIKKDDDNIIILSKAKPIPKKVDISSVMQHINTKAYVTRNKKIDMEYIEILKDKLYSTIK